MTKTDITALREIKADLESDEVQYAAKHGLKSVHDAYPYKVGAAISAIGWLIESENTDNWISTKDRLPASFRPVIVCREKAKGEYVVEQGFKDIGDWWKVYGTRTKKVTHWMPLPLPPQEDTADA